MNFLASIGTVGCYQWRVIGLLMILMIPEWSNYGVVVFIPDIGFRCLDFNTSDSQCYTTLDFALNVTSNYSSVQYNGVNTTKEENYDLTCRNFEYDHSQFQWTLTERFDLVCDRKYLVSLMKSAYLAGYFTGSIISGILADKFGRKSVISVSCLCAAAVNLTLALVPNVWAYLTFRYLQATLEISVYLTVYVLATETVHRDQRYIPKFLDTMLYDVFAIILGILCYVLSNHVHYHLLFIVVHLVMFVWTLVFVMESPRWLFARNRQSEALKVIERMSEVNKRSEDDTDFLKEEEEVKEGNFIDLFRTNLIRKRTLILFAIWFFFVLAYYTITYNLDDFSSDVRISLMISGAIEVFSSVPTAMLIKRFGRTSVQFVLLLGTGVCCLAMAPFVHDKSHPALTTLALSGKLMLSNTFFIMFVYTPELYPTVIRGTGLGACSTTSRLVAIVGPQLALVNAYWPPFMVTTLGVLALSVAFLVPLLPDMTGIELAQSIDDGEKLFPGHTYSLRKAVKMKGERMNGNAEALMTTVEF